MLLSIDITVVTSGNNKQISSELNATETYVAFYEHPCVLNLRDEFNSVLIVLKLSNSFSQSLGKVTLLSAPSCDLLLISGLVDGNWKWPFVNGSYFLLGINGISVLLTKVSARAGS